MSTFHNLVVRASSSTVPTFVVDVTFVQISPVLAARVVLEDSLWSLEE